MIHFDVQPDIQHIGAAAASLTVTSLGDAIRNHGTATWVLAGGTAPMTAYKIIASDYRDAIDWSKVTTIIGDERCAPLDSDDCSWHQIAPILFTAIPAINQIRPKSDLSAEAAAVDYETAVAQLPKTAADRPRFDVVWLGVGEDGHTLSLFPSHPGLQSTEHLVIPVHNSPKPPADRISLSLGALGGTTTCIIMAAGASKTQAIQHMQQNDSNLPIVRAAQTIASSGGTVILLVDTAASSAIT